MLATDLAAWTRALTLAERIAALGSGRLRNPETSAAGKRIARWRSQTPFGDDRRWAERLAADGLDEAGLRELLSAPQVSGEAPRWWRDLQEAYASPNRIELDRDLGELAGFFAAAEPLLAWKLASVRSRIAEMAAAPGPVPFDPGSVHELLLLALPERMAGALSRTLALELNVARLEGRLRGRTAEERFRSFLDSLDMAALFEEYPVLGRQAHHRADAWLDAGVELLEHLRADWPRLVETFAGGADPGPLTDLQGGLGDRHRGREVLIATFASGLRVVYKPRSMSVDAHFQELLRWLNDQGQEPALRTVAVLDRGGHGWMEFVPHAPCASKDEVRRFYRRQGSCLALLYAIQASDFHHENLIAAGEHPVLIDLESLFQARVGDMDVQHSDLAAAHALGRSVLEVGLLPQRVWGDRERDGIDLSGLGAAPGQVIPHHLPYWESAGTDSMRLGRRPGEMPAGHNRPLLEGEEIDLLDHEEDLVDGFRRTWRLLAERREGFLDVLDRFAGDEVRSVARPTQTYGLLLMDSFHPDFLRDAVDRDRHFDRLWVPIASRPYLARLIPFEKADLWRGDIPIFTFHPGSRDLFASDGTRIPDFFDRTGLETVRERVEQLGEEDLERQLWFVRASLLVSTIDLHRAAWPSYEVAPPQRPASCDRMLAQAEKIGDHLARLAIRGAGEVTWIGIFTETGRYPSLVPLKLDLYSGNPGLALFLAHLGAATGEARFTDVARQAVQGVRRLVRKDPSLVTCLGALGGWGGLLYTWTRLAALWQEPELLREAAAMVETFAGQIGSDPYYDLLTGSAGCIAGLLALHTVLPAGPSDRLLDAALACGERLLAGAVLQEDGGLGWPQNGGRPWGGMAHGAAGCALALLRLAAVTGDRRFQDAALAGMAYERTLFNPEVGNWRDVRDLEEVHVAVKVGEETYMTAWCHGSAGIGLARLAGLPCYDDSEVRAEIEAALADTLRNGFGQNHSLCHGDLGNLDLLLEAARRLDPVRWQPEVDRLSASVLDCMEERGWLSGVALGVQTPGLMTGLAGIGLGLLRLADPGGVPDLLTFEPPRAAALVPCLVTRWTSRAPSISEGPAVPLVPGPPTGR
ncbi:MAG: type 2 lanthipeptide synthetase LanM family protein [Thermoanaerobaculia bacterium]